MFDRLREDIDSIMNRDPAARSRLEVLLCYPGLHAVIYHRLSSAAWKRQWFLLGRFISHIGRVVTGIEIHPGATLGRRLFIDHGMGCVIGETAEIGDDVTLYHDVTLGGISLHEGKRHPTLGNRVIVGAGAQVLGPITVGDDARVGANSVVLKDVPAGATMVGIPARQAMPRPREADNAFSAYGTLHGEMPDPVARAVTALTDEIKVLRERVETLEGARGSEDDQRDKRSA